MHDVILSVLLGMTGIYEIALCTLYSTLMSEINDELMMICMQTFTYLIFNDPNALSSS